ncbi:MAG: transglutaminase-like domain-containing protein [Nanoarchaeota archaeon]
MTKRIGPGKTALFTILPVLALFFSILVSAVDQEEQYPYDFLPERNFTLNLTTAKEEVYQKTIITLTKFLAAQTRSYDQNTKGDSVPPEQENSLAYEYTATLEQAEELYWWIRYHPPEELLTKPTLAWVTYPIRNIFWKAETYDVFDGRRWSKRGESHDILPEAAEFETLTILHPEFNLASEFNLIRPDTPESSIDFRNFRKPKKSFIMSDSYSDTRLVSNSENNFLNYSVKYAPYNPEREVYYVTPYESEVMRQNTLVPPGILQELSSLALELKNPSLPLPVQLKKNAEFVRNYLTYDPAWFAGIGLRNDSGNILEYILTNRKGTSPHYTTLFILISRIQGIPARFASGYVSGVAFENKSYVYDSFSYTWPEIYEQGKGWIPYDLAPFKEQDKKIRKLAGMNSSEPITSYPDDSTLQHLLLKHLAAWYARNWTTEEQNKTPEQSQEPPGITEQEQTSDSPEPHDLDFTETIDIEAGMQLAKKSPVNCDELEDTAENQELLKKCGKETITAHVTQSTHTVVYALFLFIGTGGLLFFYLLHKKKKKKRNALEQIKKEEVMSIMKEMLLLGEQKEYAQAIIQGYNTVCNHLAEQFRLVMEPGTTAREFIQKMPTNAGLESLSVLVFIFEKYAYGFETDKKDYDVFMNILQSYAQRDAG